MAEVSKHAHVYDKTKPERLYIAMRDVVCVVRDRLGVSLQAAVLNHSHISVAYLLAHGVPPDTGKINLVEKALEPPVTDVEMAKLLRAHHAPMNDYALNSAYHVSDALCAHLRNPPSTGLHRRKPVPAYHFVRNDVDGPHMRVCQSWPPASVPAPPPHEAYVLPGDTRHSVGHLWHSIGKLRRAEAQQLSKYNWARARLLVKMRALALYWQEETQKRLCAPGGKGRAKDLEAFCEAFASSA